MAFYKDGSYETTTFELTNHYDFGNIIGIYKQEDDSAFNAVHYDAETKTYLVKRFIIETNTLNKRFSIVSEAKGSKLLFISKGIQADVEVTYKEGRKHVTKQIDLINLIDIKGWKAIGNKFPVQDIIKVELKKTVEAAPSPVEVEPVKEVTEQEKPEVDTTPSIDLAALKEEIKEEVEDEENQLGLFGANGKE